MNVVKQFQGFKKWLDRPDSKLKHLYLYLTAMQKQT